MSDPQRILVCRLSALGDIVLTLPVVEALRERFPAARLEYLARAPFGRVLAGDSRLDALHLWTGPGAPAPEAVRATDWDLAVDLSGTGRSRALLAGVRAGRRLRIRKETLARFAFVHLRAVGGARVPLHSAVDRMFSAVRELGILPDGRAPRFPVPAPPAGGPVLIAPGAGRRAKCWPEERFAEVAAELAREGRDVLLVGTEAERPGLERIAARAPADRTEIIAGADPAELPRLAARAPVALTNDSGLLHVAEAAGSAVVALFGPTHPRLGFGPRGDRSIALHTGIPCSPCDLHGPETCPRGHHRCLRDLPVGEVLDAVRERLSGEAAWT